VLSLQWCQDVSSANNTTVSDGSIMFVNKIG
jgi:hypothetical protein